MECEKGHKKICKCDLPVEISEESITLIYQLEDGTRITPVNTNKDGMIVTMTYKVVD